MEGLKGFRWCFIAISSMAFLISLVPVNGQISTGCTTSMITGFTPCLSYITGSSANGSSPTTACCQSLQSIMGSSMDCMCLIVTGNVPLSLPNVPIALPINRTLSLSLPRACNMPGGVPLQCKAAGSPIAAPGTGALGPTSSEAPTPAASATSETASPDLAPTGLPPASTPVSSQTPVNTGSKPVLTPSAANPSHSFSPSLLLFVLGVVVLKYH